MEERQSSNKLILIVMLAIGVCLGSQACTLSGQPVVQKAPPTLLGRWVLDSAGKPIPPREFERGLQTSGLLFYKGVLWSVGDQRSEYPGHLLRLKPESGWIMDKPIRIQVERDSKKSPLYRKYQSIRNPDFEGIALHPFKIDTFLGVTEDKHSWVVEIKISNPTAKNARASITEITQIDFAEGVEAYRGDSNYRLEGITISRKKKLVYLAYERMKDGLPRIFTLSLLDATSGGKIRPEEFMNFTSVPIREDKKRARLNINGIDIVHVNGEEVLLAVARDQERILIIDPNQAKVTGVVDVAFQSPDGEKIFWVSPEGIAADLKSNRLWIINDPDSIRGNYRLSKNKVSQNNFAAFAPMLFESPLAEIIPLKR